MKVYKDLNDFIYLSDKEEITEIYYTEILYNFPGWKMNDVLPLIRKWKILGTNINLYFKNILNFFSKYKKIKDSKDLPEADYHLKKLEDSEISNIYPSFILTIRKLNQLSNLNITKDVFELLDMFLPYVEYMCDFENIFRTLFGKDIGKTIIKLLSKMKSESFRKKIDDYLKLRNKDDQLDFLLKEDNIELLPFLDNTTKIRVKLQESKKIVTSGVIMKSKFLNEELLYTDIKIKEKLKDRITSAFKVGEIITGDIIKNRLNNIWEDLRLNGRPKLKTIFSYFNTNIQRAGYKFLTIKTEFE